MGVHEEVRSRGPSLQATTVLILIMLHQPHVGRATAASPLLEYCLVGDTAAAKEFLLDSETNQRMLGSSDPIRIAVKAVQNRKQPAQGCGQRGKPYCVPKPNKPLHYKEKCSTFKRRC